MSDSRRERVRERLLRVMDQKNHWAWPHLTQPGLTRAQLLSHFRCEFQVYVRDFPVLLARILGQGPPASVRRALAENLYEEQTGGLSLGQPHPELFIEMMQGLGFEREDLEKIEPPLPPEAIRYRAYLDEVSAAEPWVVGAGVLTIFVEGSVHERLELAGERAVSPVEEAIARHPMVRHYGCPPDKMRLLRAHRQVEGGHRSDAWTSVLDYVHDDRTESLVGEAVEKSLTLWLAYRDGVAREMALAGGPSKPDSSAS